MNWGEEQHLSGSAHYIVHHGKWHTACACYYGITVNIPRNLRQIYKNMASVSREMRTVALKFLLFLFLVLKLLSLLYPHTPSLLFTKIHIVFIKLYLLHLSGLSKSFFLFIVFTRIQWRINSGQLWLSTFFPCTVL